MLSIEKSVQPLNSVNQLSLRPTKEPDLNRWKVYLMACSLWALRTSGFWFLLAMISAKEAPVMALWNFTARRVRFFATSSCEKHMMTDLS